MKSWREARGGSGGTMRFAPHSSACNQWKPSREVAKALTNIVVAKDDNAIDSNIKDIPGRNRNIIAVLKPVRGKQYRRRFTVTLAASGRRINRSSAYCLASSRLRVRFKQ
jgi:hypothetical protein